MDRLRIVFALAFLSLVLVILIYLCVTHFTVHKPSVTNEISELDKRIACGINDAGSFLFPWLALLFNPNISDAFCGGSLIADRFVLTSAHCVNGEPHPWNDIIVHLGGYDKAKDADCATDDDLTCADPVQDFMIGQVFLHPDYNRYDKMNDIALIKLDRPAVINSNVRPICLPINDPPNDKLQDMYIARWKRTADNEQPKVVQPVRVNVIKNATQLLEKMQRAFKGFKLGVNHVLAGGNGTANHCNGDSGGPLMYQCGESNQMHEYAIISQGKMGCSTAELPDVYTKVGPYVQWIRNTTNIL